MDIRKNRTVKVGSISKLQILFVRPDFPSDKMLDSYGEYDYKPQTVSIIENLSDEDLNKTNLHELFHVIVRECHLNQDGNPLAKDVDEERVVGQLETQLYQYFLDNPDEIAFLFYDILKRNPKTRKLIATIK